MAISSYNPSASLNTSLAGINVGEGMNRSDVNNAIRQVMADIALAGLGYVPIVPQTYGADATGAADSAPAFASAIAALPALGGRIRVPAGTYRLDTTPALGTRSVVWDIDPDATFTGAGTGEGKFPYMTTNPAQMAVGPYIRSQTHQKSTNVNGGIGAYNVELIQPADYGAGQAVAFYSGTKAQAANAGANTWVHNIVHRIEATALGTHQAIEIDVDCFSTAANVKGLTLTGAGTANPDKAMEVTRVAASATNWAEGITIERAQDGFVVTSVAGGRGVVLHGPTAQAPALANTAISARQFANNVDTLFMARSTDTTPTGYFLRAVNAANSASLALIDVLGNATFAGNLTVAGTTNLNGKAVTEGAADSGGAGYRVLRVPN